MKKPTEQQFRMWAKGIRASDQKAFDELFRAFFPALVHFSMRYLQDKTASKDVVQDSFIALWQGRSRIDETLSLKSYLYRMVRNRSLNFLRDRAALDVNHELASFQQQGESTGLQGETSEGRIRDDETDLASHMDRWIATLPERQREAFQLSRFEGLDHEEIAHVMNVSPKTVNNHIVAALNTLREQYEEYTNSVKK